MWEQYEEKAKLKPLKKAAEKKLKAAKNSGDPAAISAAEAEAQPIIKAYEQSKKFVNGCYGMTSTRIYETEIYWGMKEGMQRNGLYEDKRKDRNDGQAVSLGRS
jgi:hypothetical protein